jgi:hypothetical protein
MNKKQLKEKLDILNVPESSYSLDGNLFIDGISLYNSYNDWIVMSINEKGGRHEEVFKSEDKACEYILEIFNRAYNYHERDFKKIFQNLLPRPYLNLQEKGDFWKKVDFHLPAKFADFYRRYNGLQGKIGQNTLIEFWKIENIINHNSPGYILNPNNQYLLFGEDRMSFYYAFGKTSPGIYQIKKSHDIKVEQTEFAARDLDEFLVYLYDRDELNNQ